MIEKSSAAASRLPPRRLGAVARVVAGLAGSVLAIGGGAILASLLWRSVRGGVAPDDATFGLFILLPFALGCYLLHVALTGRRRGAASRWISAFLDQWRA